MARDFKLTEDTRIAVLYGGMSSEREVSLKSGKGCFEALKRLDYKNVELIDVDKNIAKILTDKNIELAFIALHGKYGEDGCIQGLLEVLGIKYTGCGVKASSICIDKEMTKKVLKASGLKVLPSVMIESNNGVVHGADFNYPLMVKPCCEGSSIGMSKVYNEQELEKALVEALKYDKQIMLEEFRAGKSLTVGVLETKDNTFATDILELRTKTDWYDNEAKYTHGLTEFILPAEIDKNTTEEIKKQAVKAHKAVGARGVSRVDFILDKDNNAYILEINTIPGMTELSDLPAQSKSVGINYDRLVRIIVESATL